MANKPFTIRVSIAHNGMTSHRTYSREGMPISRQAFCEYAFGNMLSMLITGYTDSLDLSHGIAGNRINTAEFEFNAYAVDVIDETRDADTIDEQFRISVGM